MSREGREGGEGILQAIDKLGVLVCRIRISEKLLVKTLNDGKTGEMQCLCLQNRNFSRALAGLPIKTYEAFCSILMLECERPMTNTISDAAKQVVIEKIPSLREDWMSRVLRPKQNVQR